MIWNDETGIDNVDGLLTRLLHLCGTASPVACRGQADSSWLLQTSLDRILDPNADYEDMLTDERDILEKFYVLAHKFFGIDETRRLDQLRADNRISALTILQHYHAPTRMLDWTLSPFIALYFSAIEHQDKHGAVWWFDQRAFEDHVGRRWKDIYDMKMYPHKNGVDLNDTAFETDGPAWITKLHCLPFHRIEVQQGFFTVAGRLGLEHGALIADVLEDGQYGRILVPASWKHEILDRLNRMNIHSRSLDYPGADLVGMGITRDLKRTRN